MKRTTKIWLITAASLMLAGFILFGGVMSMLKWDFTKLSTVKYETNEHNITEKFSNISIKTDTADLSFALSDTRECKVECYEEKKEKHSVRIENDTLIIERVDAKKWYEYIGINFSSPKITVYLPQGDYGTLLTKSNTGNIEIPKDLKFENIDISQSTGDVTSYASASENVKIKTSTGDICLKNISAETLSLSVSTGKITVTDVTCSGDITVSVSTGKAYLTDITCKNVISSGNTGDISLKNVVATEKFSIKRSTGTIKLENSDATEIFAKTDTGDVTGTLLTDKIFIANTDTGSVDVPKTTTGGKCEITTDTGDIRITVK